MTRLKVSKAVWLLSFCTPVAFAAGGIPVIDRTDQSQSAQSVSAVAPSLSAVAVSDASRAVEIPSVAPVPQVAVSGNAELFMMLDQLQEEVRFLRGQVEEQQQQRRQAQ